MNEKSQKTMNLSQNELIPSWGALPPSPAILGGGLRPHTALLLM